MSFLLYQSGVKCLALLVCSLSQYSERHTLRIPKVHGNDDIHQRYDSHSFYIFHELINPRSQPLNSLLSLKRFSLAVFILDFNVPRSAGILGAFLGAFNAIGLIRGLIIDNYLWFNATCYSLTLVSCKCCSLSLCLFLMYSVLI